MTRTLNRLLAFALLCLFGACAPSAPRMANVTAVTPRTLPTQVSPTPPASPTPNLAIPCDPARIAEANALPDYVPSEGAFVRAEGNRLVRDGAPYTVHGVNYYPRLTPFWHFLTRTELDVVQAEMEIIARSGFNAVRLFVRPQDVFMCYADGAIPYVPNMTRLDGILRAIADAGLLMVVVLHHDPNANELYGQAPHVLAQTRYLVARYRHEPSILAWDLRDRGDQDYLQGDFTPEAVLGWLAEAAFVVRQAAPQHLITAGWWQDSVATAPYVDIVSFQHYGEYEPLRQQIAILRDGVRNKPILLSAIGYSTFSMDETAQRNLLYQSFGEVSTNGLAGWMVYMAFDYPTSVTCLEPNCPAPLSEINRYGIWNTSYFPKLALEAAERAISGR